MSLSQAAQTRVDTVLEVLETLKKEFGWSKSDFNKAKKALHQDLNPEPKKRGRKPAPLDKSQPEPEPEPESEPEPEPEKHPKTSGGTSLGDDIQVVIQDLLDVLDLLVVSKKIYFQRNKVQYYRIEGNDSVYERKSGDLVGQWFQGNFQPLNASTHQHSEKEKPIHSTTQGKVSFDGVLDFEKKQFYLWEEVLLKIPLRKSCSQKNRHSSRNLGLGK